MLAAFMRGDDEGAMHDDATWLLDFYDTFKDFVGNDVLDLALTSLANVEGRFGEYRQSMMAVLAMHTVLQHAEWKLFGQQNAGA